MTTPAALVLPAAAEAQQWLELRRDAALTIAREAAAELKGVRPTDALAVLRRWDDAELALHGLSGMASLLASVHPVEAVRTAAEDAEAAADKLDTELSQDPELFAVFAGLSTDGLDAQAGRFLQKILTDFRRAGVDRPAEVREELRALEERLTELDQEFSRITRDDVRSIKVTADRLAGLPQDWLDAHPAGTDGLVTVTTDYPDLLPVITYCHDAEVRREIRMASLNRGYPAADKVLHELVDARQRRAELVGYPDWASFDAEVKMIGSGPAIPEFIDKIAAAAQQPARRDLDVLLTRYQQDNPDAAEVQWSDSAYYGEIIRKEQYDVDAQVVRRYLDFAKVRAGLLEVTGRLFGLRYEQVQVPTWHEDVTSFDVVRVRDGVTLGRIHLDLHPREGKYKHAAQFDLAPGVNGKSVAEGVLVCNFPRGLMEHDDVVTLFHEFGHLVHHVLGGQQDWSRFSGVATEWDFVEAPSQMLEEWAWDAEILASFATDAEGVPIPAQLVEKMRAGDEFGKGYQVRIQCFYGALSYEFHQERPTDFTEKLKALQAKYAPFPYLDDTHFYANFGHLGGYSSGYYTYQWSLVIAKDLFSAFKHEDLFDPEIAGRYRDLVLAPGGSKPAAELVADFLGRPFNFDAYAAWLAR